MVVVYLNRLLEARDNAPLRQRLLAEFEIEANRDLSTSKTLSKMGPMLGLMGTLIPMGPALVGLSTGDIASMAYNMQVAFATTVVGLFAAALMVALVSRYNMTEMFSQEDFTMVKNPGKENMEIITKEGEKINRYTPSEDQDSQSGKRGRKVGVAYELENGEIIYVPE